MNGKLSIYCDGKLLSSQETSRDYSGYIGFYHNGVEQIPVEIDNVRVVAYQQKIEFHLTVPE